MIDLKKHNITATSTVKGQLISIVLTLLSSSLIFYGVTYTLDWFYQPDSGDINFAFQTFLIMTVVVGSTYFALKRQFLDSLSAVGTRRVAINWSFAIALFLNVLMNMVLIPLIGGVNFFYVITSILLLQLGSVFCAFLLGFFVSQWHKRIKFDEFVHESMISFESALGACRNGELPYRHQVLTFWSGLGWGVLFLFLVIVLVNISQNPADVDLLGCGAFFVFISVSGFLSLSYFTSLGGKEIKNRIGRFEASSQYVRGGTIYLLTNGSYRFRTNSQVYNHIKPVEDKSIKVWYTVLGFQRFVLAFELESTNTYESQLQVLKNQEKQTGS